MHEQRWKQPVRRSGGYQHREQAAAPAASEAQPPATCRTLASDAEALRNEVPGWQAVAAAGGKRNHQLVDDTRQEKHDQRGRRGADARPQWLKREPRRELVKRRIPPASPEI